jgi:uncharacterized membrane protein
VNRAHAHLHHHGRFYAALAAGSLGYGVFTLADPAIAPAAGADSFFLAYLAASAFRLGATHQDLRRKAAVADEGILIVVLLTLAAIVLSVTGIFLALGRSHLMTAPEFVATLLGAPLGWLTLHVVSAFHYANLHYADGVPENMRPLEFPATPAPGMWDFLYFSFVIGMTAQVSDVQVRTARMRRAVLAHSTVSFLFNTVLIAMAVNALFARL